MKDPNILESGGVVFIITGISRNAISQLSTTADRKSCTQFSKRL